MRSGLEGHVVPLEFRGWRLITTTEGSVWFFRNPHPGDITNKDADYVSQASK